MVGFRGRRFTGRTHGRKAELLADDEEGSVIQRCTLLIHQLGGEVLGLSVAKRAQLKDLPDLRLYVRGHTLWWECKAMGEQYGGKGMAHERGDKLSQGQLDFLKREYEFGQIAGAGDHDALKRVVLDNPSNWRAKAWSEVGVVLLRGLRP